MTVIPFDRILVTGGFGWLGSRLVELCAHGYPGIGSSFNRDPPLPIRILERPAHEGSLPDSLRSRVEVLKGDIRNPDDCDRFVDGAKGAVLFHTAAVIHPRRTRDFYDINVCGTEKLLDAAGRAGIRRAVVVSSNSPCGCNPHPDHLFDESSPYRPYMNYGRSKMLMELAIQERFQRGVIESVIVRAPWFYGPHQPARQTLFFQMIRNGKAPIVGDGGNLRSMVYLDNLVQGLILAASTPAAAGETYWIADSRPYPMREILGTVERLMEEEFGLECAHKRLRIPSIACELAYWADKLIQGFGLYHQKVHVLSEMNKTIACSIAKAGRDLRYQPAIALEEGMRRSLQWCIDRKMQI